MSSHRSVIEGGRPFTFTPDEEDRLRAYADEIGRIFRRPFPGYRVQVVRDITQMMQICKGALDRSHTCAVCGKLHLEIDCPIVGRHSPSKSD